MIDVCSHSGEAGDLIYGLAAVKDKGGAKEFYIWPGNNRTTQHQAEMLLPLLRQQPYLLKVDWSTEQRGFKLDEWRNHYASQLNLADMQSRFLGVAHSNREETWLVSPKKRIAPVVFARSSRYHNEAVPWKKIYDVYYRQAVFVGLPSEHAEFCYAIGPVSYYYTPDYLELAKVIAGCDLFVGNQSSPRAIAEGLKRPVIVEVCPWMSNTHFGRKNAWYLNGANDEWPNHVPQLEQLSCQTSIAVQWTSL